MFKVVSMVTLYLLLGYTVRFVSQLFYLRWYLNGVRGGGLGGGTVRLQAEAKAHEAGRGWHA